MALILSHRMSDCSFEPALPGMHSLSRPAGAGVGPFTLLPMQALAGTGSDAFEAPPPSEVKCRPVLRVVAGRRADDPIRQLKRIFLGEGVPGELVWIAEVESAMNPRAESHAGAAGLFQLTAETARRFGLRTGSCDERFHPEKSASAAARYLKLLHREFGSWPLAIAAYNAGEGRVSRTLEYLDVESFREIAEHLPAETRSYVPRVLSLVADREGVSPEALPEPSRRRG